MTPLKAIRAKCLDCCNDQPKEVRLCACADCPLYQYRIGHNPALSGKGSVSNLSKKTATRTRKTSGTENADMNLHVSDTNESGAAGGGCNG